MTCLRDVENFPDDMYKFYYGEDIVERDDFRTEEEYEKAIEEKRQQGEAVDRTIRPTINKLYERTIVSLPKAGTQDLILSMLALSTHDLTNCSYYDDESIKDCFHEASVVLGELRDAFIAKHKPSTMEIDEFVESFQLNIVYDKM